MSIKNRLLGGTGIFLAALGVTLMLAVIGRYQANRRSSLEIEQRDRFGKLEEELSDSVEEMKRLTVLAKQRPQPLDTMARSTIRQLSGSRSLYGVDCTLLFCSIMFDDDFDWANTPLFRVAHGDNKELLGMETNDKLATRPQIRESEPFQEAFKKAYEKFNEDSSSLTAKDKEVLRLMEQAALTENRFRRLMRVIPPTEEQVRSEASNKNDWHLVGDALTIGHDPKQAAAANEAFRELGKAWRARDNGAVAKAKKSLDDLRIAMTPTDEHMLEESAIEAELNYNKVNPFSTSSWLFVFAAALAVFSIAFKQKWLRLLAVIATLGGLGLYFWGFYMRMDLGFKIAITNLYESMVAVGGLSALMFLIVDLARKSSWGMAFGGLAGFTVLQIVDLFSVKFDDGISGPMAVLANNIWIHIHVPIVMSAYAFFFVAFLMSLIALPWILMKKDKSSDEELDGMLKVSDIAVNLGTIFMLAGLVLGGIWANVSWGRFWGWDPKETWGLILFLWFLVIVHGRFTKWINSFWNAWLIFFGGNVLLWTYYGTNELLSGLHSYANSAGEGGFWSNFVHERNQWFVWTSGTMLAISILTAVWYQLGKKNAGGADTAPAS